jgi:hypothetical protein
MQKYTMPTTAARAARAPTDMPATVPLDRDEESVAAVLVRLVVDVLMPVEDDVDPDVEEAGIS